MQQTIWAVVMHHISSNRVTSGIHNKPRHFAIAIETDNAKFMNGLKNAVRDAIDVDRWWKRDGVMGLGLSLRDDQVTQDSLP